jgi:hypothetical protein
VLSRIELLKRVFLKIHHVNTLLYGLRSDLHDPLKVRLTGTKIDLRLIWLVFLMAHLFLAPNWWYNCFNSVGE